MDQHVIHIDDQPSFRYHILENEVHKRLKSRRTVAKAEEHDERLEEAEGRDERRLPGVFSLDPDIVIPPTDIHLCKVLGSLELIHQVANKWERIGILDGVLVEISVILAGAKITVLLRDEEEW